MFSSFSFDFSSLKVTLRSVSLVALPTMCLTSVTEDDSDGQSRVIAGCIMYVTC